MKYIYIAIAFVVLGLLIWLTLIPTFFSADNPDTSVDITEAPPADDGDAELITDVDEAETDNVTPETEDLSQTTIGTSAGGNDIVAYHYGTGAKELLLIGGIHGGYSWNTAALAYSIMDYLERIEDTLDDIRVTVIPALNPDGLESVFGTAANIDFGTAPTSVAATVPGRFNANEVDLNRNFDCQWQPEATWQNQSVSGGSAPFSEPEAQAIRSYTQANDIAGAVVWYSAAGGVYSSNCQNGVLPTTGAMTDTYADAANYPAYAEYDYYEVTGDMVNWFSKQNIPGISVLLTNHSATEESKNIAGVDAIIKYFQTN